MNEKLGHESCQRSAVPVKSTSRICCILYKASARTAEHKRHVIGDTLIVQDLDPFIVAWTCAAVVFSIAKHMFDLTFGQVAVYILRRGPKSKRRLIFLRSMLYWTYRIFMRILP